MTLKGKNITDIKFNGKNIPVLSEGKTKIFPIRGMNRLLVKSNTPDFALEFLGRNIIPLKFSETDNGYYTEFYSQSTNLKLMGRNPTVFSAASGNGQFFIWEIAKSGHVVSDEKQYAALHVLLPETVKLIGAASKSDFPQGCPPIKTIAPRNNIYRVEEQGKVKVDGKTFIHYIISTEELKKYPRERGMDSRVACVVMLKPEKVLPENSKFYYFSVWGKKIFPSF